MHIDLANSLSTDSAMIAIQRLAKLYSDNGSNFLRAEKAQEEAVKALDESKLPDFALSKNIGWFFNSPDAPHMGGVWKILVRSVMTVLYTVLKEQAPRKEVLIALLVEVEHSVNSRPLTHVSLDIRDEKALIPNHFLIGTSSGIINLGNYNDSDVCLRKKWKLEQYFAHKFWRKWNEKGEPIKIGDIILIVNHAHCTPTACRRSEIRLSCQMRIISVKTSWSYK